MTCCANCWEKGAERGRATHHSGVPGARRLSVQRACHLVGLHRSTFHYTAHPRDETALVDQIQTLAVQHPRYGYRRIHVLLNRPHRVNQKRVRRLWRRQRLQVRRTVRPRLRRPRPPHLSAAFPRHI